MIQHILFISGGEIVLVMMLALLFFGSKAIPDIAKTMGKGMREFKKATNEIKREINDNTGDFKRDIDDIKSTVKGESQKITSDFNDVSSSMKEGASSLKNDISDGISYEDEYDYPDHGYSDSAEIDEAVGYNPSADEAESKTADEPIVDSETVEAKPKDQEKSS